MLDKGLQWCSFVMAGSVSNAKCQMPDPTQQSYALDKTKQVLTHNHEEMLDQVLRPTGKLLLPSGMLLRFQPCPFLVCDNLCV